MMKIYIKYICYTLVILITLNACDRQDRLARDNMGLNDPKSSEDEHHETEILEDQVLHLSQQHFDAMGIKVDSLPTKNLSGFIEANGQLEVPPQNEAAITAIIGANITSIRVIEGDKVNQGQALAYLSHPDLIKLQTDYSNAFNQLDYLEKDFERQKRLYDEGVSSGKQFQQTQADYRTTKGTVKGIESQLRLLNLNLDRIRGGNVYDQVPVISPIDGYVEKVKIKIGQFVPQQKELFEIVNTDHVHADLMVFEKDVSKVKEGQTVEISIESLPDSELKATIYSVGKTFEDDPKAVHIHAELENKRGNLYPGMYLSGKIATSNQKVVALPEEAIINENGSTYIFTVNKVMDHGSEVWAFSPLRIITAGEEGGWVAIKLLRPLKNGEKVAWNNGYYLISEMRKGETGHSH